MHSLPALLLPVALCVVAAIACTLAAMLWRTRGLAGRSGGIALPEVASTLADDLAHAVTRNELFLVHQPKMRARSGEGRASMSFGR